jgi:hypothetical protein
MDPEDKLVGGSAYGYASDCGKPYNNGQLWDMNDGGVLVEYGCRRKLVSEK